MARALSDMSNRIPYSCALWTLNSLGAYFYQLPKLEMIFTSEEAIKGDDYVVVIASDVPYWPLAPEDVLRLRTRLNGTSGLTKRDWYPNLEVYSTGRCIRH